ncbi:Glyoxylase, beta-lactamase superfamily II [Desulfacinum hydrothermale DSM 13146]|uniref:Glyoxylase, beta-lactamase superfamily II n=1 Tax=Desulfacinum hydrothermale DSM 13146 TaxID=1121390 RepID=A0A1W1XDG6_9BACT|nr:MBL fold metallo-hydrolase [Desulfacinum hydrothermale]SMC21920.1 Glyoxylase, beta-lactamase superfamily II [Desulfacinum hydrothermale DSM 13146]
MTASDPVLLTMGEMEILRFVLGPYQVNAYGLVCRDSGETLLIDAPRGILAALGEVAPKAVVLTHGHRDHTEGLEEVAKELRVPIFCHDEDAARIPVSGLKPLQDGDTLSVGSLTVRVLHTPGHTPGSICLHWANVLFSGDTLFPRGPGRTDSPAAFRQILTSLEKRIFSLPVSTLVLPGHGPPTNVGVERDAARAFLERGVPDDLFGDVDWGR